MGEVYRARDTRLRRDVAVKVLPDRFATDAERLRRFQQEALATAALNHPNIVAVYDVGTDSGVSYVVVELLEGRTLREVMKAGGPAMETAIDYAVQIANGLAAAHDKGIVHRDLKPDNLFVTRDKRVKILDFGLARMQPTPSGQAEDEDTIAVTAAGDVFGTPGYMAPEQVRGQTVDSRADLFAFGAIVYEMVTGRKAFTGEIPASRTAAILEQDPPALMTLAPLAPPALARVIGTCLAKDPDERWRSAHDLKVALQWIAENSHADGVATAASRFRPRLVAAVALAALAGTLTATITMRTRGPAAVPQSMLRTTIMLPSAYTLWTDGPSLAMAPDGQTVAFIALRDVGRQLFLRRLDEFDARPVRGGEEATSPVFSPDGEWVAFFAGGKVLKVSVRPGSIPLTIVGAGDPQAFSAGHWAADGTILFTPAFDQGLARVAASGGVPAVATTVDRQRSERTHRWPQMLPGGSLLYTAYFSNRPGSEIRVLSEGSSRTVIEQGAAARYIDGHLLYLVDGSLYAVPFNVNTLSLEGQPALVLDDVLMSGEAGESPQIGTDGGRSFVYVPRGSTASAARTLVQVDRQGQARTLLTTEKLVRGPRFSPDGGRLLFSAAGDLWIYDVHAESWSRLTYDGTNRWPIWTPDGTRVLFQSSRMGPFQMFAMPVSGSADPELLLSTTLTQWPSSLTPDGQVLVFSENHPSSSGDIWTVRLNGERTPTPFIQTPPATWAVRLTGDGKWLLYVSFETGQWEVFVTAFPSGEGKWQISSDGGTEPVWSPSGRELFYRDGDRVMVVPIETSPTFRHGKPRLLFEGRYLHCCAGLPEYAVAADGKSFLMLRGDAEQVAQNIRLVRGWTTP